MRVSLIGLDIAKYVFHLVGFDPRGNEVLKKQLRRKQVLSYFAQLEPCLVGIETCGGANHWGRELEKLGHRVKLVSPNRVKADRVGAKNDYNDARAIAEVAARAHVRAIPIKTVEQSEVQALHRARELVKKQINQNVNALRGHLTEFGIVVTQSVGALRRRVPEVLEDADNGLGAPFREVLDDLYRALCTDRERLAEYDRRIARALAADERAQLAAQTPGVGPLTATAVTAMRGDLSQFRCAKDFGAALGLVPSQHGTGGRTVLGGINKRSDPYLRTLFIHGARSVLNHAHRHPDDPMCRWALAVKERRGANIAAVALANKLARITWAVLTTGQPYRPQRLRARSA